MLMDDDDESDFAEVPEEEQPEKLRRKWESEDFQDEFEGRQTVPCSHCGKWIERRSLTCLYCGEKVFYETGALGRIVGWLSNGKYFWILAALIAIIAFVMIRL